MTVELWSTSNVFKKGHVLRLEVSSSNFPRFDRNLNTGLDMAHAQDLRVGHQRDLSRRSASLGPDPADCAGTVSFFASMQSRAALVGGAEFPSETGRLSSKPIRRRISGIWIVAERMKSRPHFKKNTGGLSIFAGLLQSVDRHSYSCRPR